MRPENLNKKRPDEGGEVEDRILLFTLLSERYEVVRRIGYWFWGEEFDRHTPALGGGVRRSRKKKGDEDAPATPEAVKEPSKPAPLTLVPAAPAPANPADASPR